MYRRWWGGALYRIDFDADPFATPSDKRRYQIFYADIQEHVLAAYGGPQRLLRALRDTTGAQFPGAKIRHDHVMRLDRGVGRAFVVVLDDDGGFVDCRLLLVGGRYFQLSVGSKYFFYYADHEDVLRFFRSFRIFGPEDYM